MSDEVELKKCPLCKSENVSRPISLNGYWWCENCKNPFIPGIDGWVSIRPLDLELNYVSKISFNALQAKVDELTKENAKLKEVGKILVQELETNGINDQYDNLYHLIIHAQEVLNG